MSHKPFFIQHGNIFVVPITHYTMEMAHAVRSAFLEIQPDCVAVELPETMSLQLLHAASRLPDISVIISYSADQNPLYYLSEPCDPAFEALRSALENSKSAYCIDLDVDLYPEIQEPIPDPYAIKRIGLKRYYELYRQIQRPSYPLDQMREEYMAKRLKELALQFDKVLFVCGMAHAERIIKMTDQNAFPLHMHAPRSFAEIATLTEDSTREVMAESGWISSHYEQSRNEIMPDRQKLIYKLYKEAGSKYSEETGNPFPGYNLRNTMKFARNYALTTGRLLPDLYQTLTASKSCVDANFAYETWKLATDYPYRKNIDNLPEIDLSVEDLWGHSKLLKFQLKQKNPKALNFERRKKDRSQVRFKPPGPFSICSYPPEDVAVERFGDFLKKKGTQILTEEAARTVPFTASIEDGIDTRETIRHFTEKKLYVKARGKPPGGVGSIVMIFDEDSPLETDPNFVEKYPWRTTWLGEHNQESDMSFFATPMTANVVGPGISRCEYGGFMMSYPPRRLMDVWHDPDYEGLRTKAEVLLAAAIDYAVKPVIVYVASKPPRTLLKSLARKFGKKIVYIPIGQLSPITLNKLRVFHVLDGHDRRDVASEYIF